MTFVFQIYAHSFLAAFVGLLLTYQFMQLFVTAVNLAASAVGDPAVLGRPADRRPWRPSCSSARSPGRQAGRKGRAASAGCWARRSTRTSGGRSHGPCDTFSTLSCPRTCGRTWRGTRCWRCGGPRPAGRGVRAGRGVPGSVGGGQRPDLRPTCSGCGASGRRRASAAARRASVCRCRRGGAGRADLLAATDDGDARGRPAADGDGDLRAAMTGMWTGLGGRKRAGNAA